ncbi:glutamine--fructose-6-phosphate transaminase (isomerizing) [Patescibacteria group bacterium]|nr:glutamine--fructose-6-phosphate transaminase (isomerizing) [Patescibacteria group bacterium]MBU4580355.1 glutamine--fructose-6-phosphate transaminase (isomerizing) [Patescibacteria group bacterium]
MCGIIGYTGPQKTLEVLISGLKNLEYRGYDSAGVAVAVGGGKIFSLKNKGRILVLENNLKTKGDVAEQKAGIAHTRWATHGAPSEINSHPHADCMGKIYVVHNGIIENYRALRKKLEAEGHKFVSETDTEVLSHLIEKYYNGALEDAVRLALKEVIGAYGIAVISASEPKKIVAARLSSPLIVGIGDKEAFVASDVSAIINYTRKVIYLDDSEMAVVGPTSYKIMDLDNNIVEKQIKEVSWEIKQAQKGGFSHFLLKEINEAPEAIRNAIRGRINFEDGTAKLGGLEMVEKDLAKIERLLIVACGSADYAARVGEYMIEEYAGIATESEVGSEFRYKKPILDKKTAVLAISQSGETADTLMAVKEAKRKGSFVFGLINTVGSSIARECGVGVYNHAGLEVAVPASKSFISQTAILALLAVFLGRQREMSLVMGARILKELNALPGLAEQVLKQDDLIKKIAEKYSKYKNFLYLGRKYNYPIALEGALKLKEVAYYIHAEGYPAGEIKHGPIAMIDENFPSVVIAPQDSVYDKMVNAIQEIKARNGKVIAIATEGDRDVEILADDVIYIPKTLEMLTPILAVLPLYLFAAHMGVITDCDIDKPRNLAKSVTVE